MTELQSQEITNTFNFTGTYIYCKYYSDKYKTLQLPQNKDTRERGMKNTVTNKTQDTVVFLQFWSDCSEDASILGSQFTGQSGQSRYIVIQYIYTLLVTEVAPNISSTALLLKVVFDWTFYSPIISNTVFGSEMAVKQRLAGDFSSLQMAGVQAVCILVLFECLNRSLLRI